MKIFIRALWWSVCLEGLLIAPVGLSWTIAAYPAVQQGFDDHLRILEDILGPLTYAGLYCHAPAFYLLGHWPAVQRTDLTLLITQWAFGYIAFVLIFTLRSLFHKPNQERNKHAI